MIRIHFIAIGGSAMHSLALAMKKNGHKITGSDDAIFDPSKTKLENGGLLPKKLGWFPEKINNTLDVIVLGMHAKADNPELIRAQKLNLKIQSYPEFLASMCQGKTRIVIAGSHGKTTITAMILHVLNYHQVTADFMVGAPIFSLKETLSITSDNDFILLEGDEYLSSTIDRVSKFLWYLPEIALISGIAWDHVNVFPTFKNYVNQFEKFIFSIQEGGVLIYNEEDSLLKKLVESSVHPIKKIPYKTPKHQIESGITFLDTSEGSLPLSVFGQHNLMNLAGAQWVAQLMGIDASDFYEAIPSFKGAKKRLELISQGKSAFLFKDFAHAPSKVKATTNAIGIQFPSQNILVCLELHTYSSLDATFLKQYINTLNDAHEAIVFFDPEALRIKNRAPIDLLDIERAFNHTSLNVFTDFSLLQEFLFKQDYFNRVLIMMSSGNFGGLDWGKLKTKITLF